MPVQTGSLWLPMQAGALQGTDFPVETAAGFLSARPEGGCRITTCAGPMSREELYCSTTQTQVNPHTKESNSLLAFKMREILMVINL